MASVESGQEPAKPKPKLKLKVKLGIKIKGVKDVKELEPFGLKEHTESNSKYKHAKPKLTMERVVYVLADNPSWYKPFILKSKPRSYFNKDDLNISETDFIKLMKKFIFIDREPTRRNLRSLINSKTVAKQVAQLNDNIEVYLQSSIYISFSDTDLSYYEFIISGPADSPYDNGLFLFNMSLPSNYPQSPPIVNFLSSLNMYRVNPNLYTDGKVCLNLLNTFGNAWNSSRTLLDIIFAIQSHILVDFPLNNEPTIRTDENSCIMYNFLIRITTMIVGIIHPLTHPYPGFIDMIKCFFYGPKKGEIISQMTRWINEAENITLDQCSNYITDGLYSYAAGPHMGVGFIPLNQMRPDHFRSGIIELTRFYGSAVIDLLS